MAHAKEREKIDKRHPPGIDRRGDRPMREGGDRQAERSDWREKAAAAETRGPGDDALTKTQKDPGVRDSVARHDENDEREKAVRETERKSTCR